MQFHLNETQTTLRDGARRLLSNEFDSAKARAVEASADGFSQVFWSQLTHLGWNSVALAGSGGWWRPRSAGTLRGWQKRWAARQPQRHCS